MTDRLLLFFADCWDDMWRRRQQLAWRLAQSDVIQHTLYVERPLPLTSLLKFLIGRADRDGTERWRRVLRHRSRAMPVGQRLTVLATFAPLPPVGAAALFRASEWARDQRLLSQLRRRHCLNRPWVWISHPQISMGVIRALEPSLLWYDCTEDFSAWPGLPDCARAQIAATDRWLTEQADVVTAVSRTLYEEKRRVNPNTHWLPNAVDTELFLRPGSEFPLPPELRDAARPVLAFVGGMSEWAHDWSLLDQVAGLRPGWTFLLIGPLSVSAETRWMLGSHPNILWVGQKAYRQLPAYLAHSDICFQFYRPGRKSDTRNSQKLFLYFAAGKPVVSTPSADVDAYREWVRIVTAADEYVREVEASLLANNRTLVARRLALARRNSWTARTESVLEMLQDVARAG